VDTLGNIGAVPVGSSAIIPLQLGPKVQTSVYHVPHVQYRVRAVLSTPWRPALTGEPGGRRRIS